MQVVLENRYLGEFNQFVNVDHEYMKSFALEYSFRHNYTMNKEAIAEAILTRYTFWPDKANEWMIREKFVDMATDTYYVAPVSQSAHLHSQVRTSLRLSQLFCDSHHTLFRFNAAI